MEPKSKRYSARLKDVLQESDGVYTFVFETDEPLPYAAGQYAHLKLPEMPSSGVHEFSLSSAPGEDPAFTTRVRDESEYKQFLKNMRPGSPAEIFKLKGEFTVPDERPAPVFVAQGIGITPVRSIVTDRSRRSLSLPPALVHVGRSFPFEQELAAHAFPQYRIGRPEIDTTLERIVPAHQGAFFYAVGSPEFVLNINEKLTALDVDESRLKTDDWGY